MKRRSRSEADTRLDWRDPDMPVLGASGREIDYHKMQIKAEMRLLFADEPDWRDDPTYNLRRKPR